MPSSGPYFATMGIGIQHGPAIGTGDRADTAAVGVISARLVGGLFGDRDPQ
jgi:hypothetical protein